MRVRAKIPFVSKINGIAYRPKVDDVIEMPDGADWIKAGLVEPVVKPAHEQREKRIQVPKEVRAEDVLRPGHVDDLTIVPGIGPKTQEALHLMGIKRLGDVAVADPILLAAKLDGASERQVRKWQTWLGDNAQ